MEVLEIKTILAEMTHRVWFTSYSHLKFMVLLIFSRTLGLNLMILLKILYKIQQPIVPNPYLAHVCKHLSGFKHLSKLIKITNFSN